MAIGGGDGSIILTTQVDQTGLKRGMSSMQSGVKSLTKGFTKLGAVIGVAFSIKAIVQFSNEAAKMASETEANVQRLIDIYGKASQEVGNFIDANANAIGMSKAVAISTAATYGNLLSVWADQSTNAQLTNRLLNQTAVIASKTGRTTEDVAERIRSGLLGNTEAIEDLGVNVNIKTIEITDAFRRIADGRSWEQLNAYEQAQVRTLAILEQSVNKYGSTVATNSAFTRQQYNAAFQDFKNTWGTVVNYVLMPVLRALTKVFQFATMALQAIFKISGKTINVDTSSFEQQEQAIGGAVGNQEDLTDAVKGTAKEQKKLLAGFDDLEILSQNSSGGGSASGGGVGGGVGALTEFTETQGTPPVDTTSYDNLRQILSDIKEIFMTGFWQGFQNADFSGIEQSISGIKDSLTGIFTSPEVQTSAQGFVSSVVLAFGQITGSIASIGTTIATNLLGGFNLYLDGNSETIKTRIANIFDASSGIATSVGNMWTAFANIFSVFASTNGQILTSNIIGIFANAGLGIAELGYKIGADFINFLTQPIIENQEGLKGVLDSLLGVFAGITGGIKTLVDELVNGVLSLYDEHISPFIQTLTEVLSEWVGKFVEGYNAHIKPIIDAFATEFQALVEQHLVPMFNTVMEYVGNVIDIWNWLWNNVLKPIGSWLIDNFLNAFGNVFNQIKDIVFIAIGAISNSINNIFTIFNGIIDFIVGVFTGDWERAWEGIKGIFTGIINGIITGIETGINLIITAINGLIGGIDNIVGAVGSVLGLNWNIPKIPKLNLPRLAQGAVIPPNREFLAVLGDQKNGTNIEAPLQTIVDAFNIALQGNANYGGGNTEVVLEIDGREFGRAVVEQGNRENRRIGTRLVIA